MAMLIAPRRAVERHARTCHQHQDEAGADDRSRNSTIRAALASAATALGCVSELLGRINEDAARLDCRIGQVRACQLLSATIAIAMLNNNQADASIKVGSRGTTNIHAFPGVNIA